MFNDILTRHSQGGQVVPEVSPYPQRLSTPPGMPPQMLQHEMWKGSPDMYGGGMPHQMLQNYHRAPPPYRQQQMKTIYPSFVEEGGVLW